MALWLLGSRKDDSGQIVCRTIRDMFAFYYFAAGVWKLNTHFIDPDASCATLFLVQHVAQYIAPLVSWKVAVSVARWAKWMAPTVTLLIELSQGSLLILGMYTPSNRTYERLGILLALTFHLVVCLTPRPNDICGFAVHCAARLIVFCSPQGIVVAWKDWIQPWWNVLMTISVALVAMGWTWFTPNNWAFALFAAIGGFVFLAVAVEDNANKDPEIPPKVVVRRWWSWIASFVAFFYAFGGLITGLQEEATPNMFANLKVHGGSNHFFLPTGLLFHMFAHAPDSHVFGGGVVRIENTTSHWLQYIYPADLTPLLMPPRVAPLLEQVGNVPPFYFNPGASRILFGITPAPERFYRYTVPALELKRLLREAKLYDRDFELVYSRLPGTKGDEVWRATAIETQYVVQVKQGQVVDCRVKKDTTTRSCSAEDLPMLDDDAVPKFFQRFSMHHAYPIVRDNVEEVPPSIVCFGP